MPHIGCERIRGRSSIRRGVTSSCVAFSSCRKGHRLIGTVIAISRLGGRPYINCHSCSALVPVLVDGLGDDLCIGDEGLSPAATDQFFAWYGDEPSGELE